MAKKLLDQLRETLRLKQLFPPHRSLLCRLDAPLHPLPLSKRRPTEMGAPEIQAFITHLAVERHVSASTQNQALSALLFL